MANRQAPSGGATHAALQCGREQRRLRGPLPKQLLKELPELPEPRELAWRLFLYPFQLQLSAPCDDDVVGSYRDSFRPCWLLAS